VLGATNASAEPIRETLDYFGFFGTWAVDCDRAPALDNNVRHAFMSSTGDAIFTESLDPNSEPNIYVVLAARRATDDTLVLRIKLNGKTDQELTMRREGERIRTFGNVELRSGAALVRNGMIRSISRPTPWLTRCSTAAEERPETQ
jgi:hypothetical protein